jgi:ubiquinone/menaquinone biosynthesis C-methylase UbiE
LLRSKPKKIVAIDFSEIAVRIAEKKFSKQISSRKIQILHNDATELSFKKDSFDAVVCFHTLGAMLFSQRKKCVGEIFRVLKKSGRVFFEDFAVGDLREKSTELKLVEKNTLQKKNGIIQHFFIEEEVEGLFSRFKIIEIKSTGECLQLGKERVLRSEVKGVFEKP